MDDSLKIVVAMFLLRLLLSTGVVLLLIIVSDTAHRLSKHLQGCKSTSGSKDSQYSSMS